jgi:hypothetical protein
MTTYDFDTVHRMAWHLGQKLSDLENIFEKSTDRWRWVGRKTQCFSIARAMDIIADTPNVRVGKKVLAAFDKQLKDTHDALAKWCDCLLSPDAPVIDESDIPY